MISVVTELTWLARPGLGAALKDDGLAKPRAVITAKGKDKAACVVRVGDETKDKLSVFVAKDKSSEVLLAPKWSVDRILVKPDDLKKAAVASKK